MKKIQKESDGIVTLKFVTRHVVGYSVSAVIVTFLHQNTQTFSTTDKAKLYIGAGAIGAILADACRDRVNKNVDGVIDGYNKIADIMNTPLVTTE